MKVSVIVANHNGEMYISRAIRSIIEQSFPKNDYEILVVDDGSTDHSHRIIESFGDWIKVIYLGEHKGLPYACNEGIRKAISRYVVRVDADDYVHEDLLRVEYLYLSLNEHIDAVACDYYLVDEKEKIVAEAKKRAAQILAQADVTIEREIQAARDRLRQEVVDVAARKAQEIIVKDIKSSDQDHLVDEFIERVEKLH